MVTSTREVWTFWSLLLFISILQRTFAQENCSYPLGMENGAILDSQITCFPSGSCYSARLNRRGSGWITYSFALTPYNQVDLLSIKRLTRIALQAGASSYFTKQYRVYYSQDGEIWHVYKPSTNSSFLGAELPGNTDGTSTVEQYLNPPIEARYIALNPTSYRYYAAMKYELYGCDADTTVQTTFTNITEDIEDDQLFVNSLSPYRIDRAINIRPGATLTIQAGVRVIFTNSDAKFVVYGSLQSEGVESVRIIFSHNSVPLGRPDGLWGGIEVGDGGELTLTKTDVWQAVNGILGSAENMELTDVGVFVCSVGLQFTSGNFNSTLNVFSGGNVYACNYGVTVSAAQTTPSYYTFHAYSIVRNLRHGLDVRCANCGLSIRNSSISQNRQYGVSSYDPVISFEMDHVSVEGNKNYGLRIRGVRSNFVLSFCSFKSNEYYSVYILNSYSASYVLNNTFDSNKRGGMWMRSRNATLSGNVFINNKGDYALQIYNQESSKDFGNITDNTFHENDKGVYISAVSNVTFMRNVVSKTKDPYAVYLDCEILQFGFNHIVNSSSPEAVFVRTRPNMPMLYNSFINPDSDYEIATGVPFSYSHVISAIYNYWGSDNGTYIRSRVKDVFLDMDLALIFVTPFFITSDMNELHTSSDPTSFTRDQYFNIGGRLVQDVVLERNTTFTVTRGIYVPIGITLTLEAGAELRFLTTRGIYVQGNLRILGEQDSKVILAGKDGQHWSGIRLVNTSCSVSFVVVNDVQSTCFAFKDMTNVSLSSVWLTGAHIGVSLTFTSSKATDLNLASNKISFQDMHISGMRSGIYITMNGGSMSDIELKKSTISSSSNYGIEINAPKTDQHRSVYFSMNACLLTQNYRSIRASRMHSFTVLIEDCQFEAENGYGPYMYLQNTSLSIFNSVFKTLRQPLDLDATDMCQNVKVQNNTFEGTVSGFDVDVYTSFSGNTENCSVDILQNFFSKTTLQNRGGIKLHANQYGSGLLNVKKNQLLGLNTRAIHIYTSYGTVLVSENTIADCNTAMTVRTGEPSSLVSIEKNAIYRNVGTDIVILSPIYNQYSPVEFSHNIMENNTNSVIKITVPHVDLHYNHFNNPDSTFEVDLSTSSTRSKEVNASHNFWGNVDSREIARKLYDQEDNANLPLLVFQPYFADALFSSIYEETFVFITPDGRIGGKVTGNLTLSLEGSPYTAVGNIEIDSGNTLLVEAGVQIKFLPNIEVIVEGALAVNGVHGGAVEFFSETPGQKWRGIRFTQSDKQLSKLMFFSVNDTLDGIKIYGNPPEMESVSVLYSSGDGFEFIHPVLHHTVPIQGLKALYNADAGIRVEFGEWETHVHLTIAGCSVQNNTDFGIRVQNNGQLKVTDCVVSGSQTGISLADTINGSLIFSSCEFYQNSERMLLLPRSYRSRGNFSFLLENSSIHNHHYSTSWSWRYRSMIDIDVSNRIINGSWRFIGNQFYDLFFHGTILDFNYESAGSNTINISGNTFVNINSQAVLFTTGVASSAVILRNRFQNVTSPREKSVVEIYPDTPRDILIKANSFKNNEGSSILFISGNPASYPKMQILSNDFINNTATNIVHSSGVTGFSVLENVFINPSASCEIRAPDFIDLPHIDARRCYWGFEELDKILPRVCAFENDMRLSRVDILPYLMSSNKDDVMSYNGEFIVDSMAGGVLTKPTIIRAGTQPHLISRSIYVETDVELRIEAGATVEFQKNCGIIVKGDAMIGSDTGIVTTLRPSTAQPWEGIIFLSTISKLAGKGSKAFVETSSSKGSTAKPGGTLKPPAVQSMSYIRNVLIDRSRAGLVLYRSQVAMFNNNISKTAENGITIKTENTVYDFNGTVVESSGNSGLYSNPCVGIALRNITVTRSLEMGIHFLSSQGQIIVDHVTLDNNTDGGINIEFSDTQERFFTLSHSKILNHLNMAVSIYVNLRYYSATGLEVKNNIFVNNSKGSFSVEMPTYTNWDTGSRNRSCNITDNTFVNSGANVLRVQSFATVNISNNQFDNSKTTENCALSVDSSIWRFSDQKLITVSTNRFENGQGPCAVRLSSDDTGKVVGSFVYNQILFYDATEAAIILDSSHYNLTDNILDNPKAVYEVKIAKAGTASVNATKNWWGSADEEEAKIRVFDRQENPSLLAIELSPVRKELQFDCSQVNNCTERGECVRPNGCRCYSGWAGSSCTEFDCAGVGQCSGRGSCIGPNICQCTLGYTGTRCELATCSNVNECSRKGYCVAPDTCTCFNGFSGPSCSSCAAERWGVDCKPCPFCVKPQGKCNLETGICMCDTNWAGEFCERCADSFYGPNCEPWVTVLNLFPNGGPDTGGTEVHVRGHNFPETANNTYYCRFRSTLVKGFRRSGEHIVCIVPQLPEGIYLVEISPNGETDFTNNRVLFSVYAKCPPNACGKNFVPPHGSCAFGGCICSLPWSGEDCSTEIIAPLLADIVPVNMEEGERFLLTLKLVQGTPPVAWFLQNPPLGMILDVRSATITWERAVGSYTPYQIVIGARNVVGTNKKTLKIRVPLSYNVTIDATNPSGILPTPKPVTITGHVDFLHNTAARVVLVDLWVRNGDNVRQISTFTDPNRGGDFEVIFYHQPQDTGEFVVSGNHPSDPAFKPQTRWTVQGLKCSPLPIKLSGYLDMANITFLGVSNLLNVGEHDVRNVKTEVLGVGSRLQAVTVLPSGNFSGSAQFISILEAGKGNPFDVTLTATGALQGTIGLVFTSELGTTTTCYASIALSIRKPRFTITPSSLRDDLLLSTQRSYQLEISNDGEAPANNIVLDLPGDGRISVVAFTNVAADSLPGDVIGNALSLKKGETAILSLTVTSLKTDSLGEIQGRIGINSDDVSAAIPYHINLVSDNRLNLTVRVEDEFTYFDESHPLVSGAMVTLSNHRQGLRLSLETTNNTGWVTFENIREDKYDLRVTGPSHGSYVAVIIANRATAEMTVFLQRTAVTYTFSVTPTTFEDRYVISLETTFEAQVPMPVVTIEPVQINTIPYEEGRKNLIEFRLTNHGLIRAENVRFDLPNHPHLIFHKTIIDIGQLEANTSIIVPVRVERRLTTTDTPTTQTVSIPPRTQSTKTASTTKPPSRTSPSTRASTARTVSTKKPTTRSPSSSGGSGSSCAIVVVYDYVCGVLRSRRITVSLTRSYPGRPPMPCVVAVVTRSTYVPSTGVTGGGGGGGYSGTGGVVVYNPVTPISCNCLKSYIQNCIPFGSCAVSTLEGSLGGILQNCILPILPISGCAKSVLGAAFPQKTFLDIIISIIDIAMSCVVSTLCPICGPIWTLIKCLVKVTVACGFGRIGKRDVSSAVMENLVMKSRPMDNFLEMSVGIFGTKAMLELNDNSWYFKFKTAVVEESPGESFLTILEFDNVLADVNDTSSRETIRNFLLRWNNTVSAFKDGTIGARLATENVIPYLSTQEQYDQYVSDSDAAKESGFDTIFDEFDDAVGIYIDGRKQEGSGSEEGVCAKVRVRIVQDLVLTRDAFNARLEIENGEESALTNIKVVLKVSPSLDPSKNATDKFAIGEAELVGLTAVDGTGSLARAISGSAGWLIVPYSTAAIRADTQYDVGGSFSYSVGSSSLTVSLLPDTITVKPNPNLEVHYFHEKYVQADDPFTDEVEPSVPFILAVMVTNTGYGIAKTVKITSAQPEIVENEKGLLVNFKITGTALNGNPIPYSLTVDFGDIDPFETIVARWYLTSSLKGLFYNYTATFENINPLGDPQLSILDVLKSHELIHAVRKDFPDDDGLDDFLVNDELDGADLADHVFDSSSGLGKRLVDSNVVDFASSLENDRSGLYTIVSLSCEVSQTGWFYVRVETYLASAENTGRQLLAVTGNDGKDIILTKNTWTSDYYRDRAYFHLFDYSDDNSTLQNYTVVFGPPNLFVPVFNQSSYNVRVKFPLSKGTNVLTVHAKDDDDDGLVTYSIGKAMSKFTINNRTGEIFTTEVIERAQTLILTVMALDDGVPQRSAMATVTITPDTGVVQTTALTKAATTAKAVSTTKLPVKSTSISATENTRIVKTTPISTEMPNVSTVAAPNFATTKSATTTAKAVSPTKLTVKSTPTSAAESTKIVKTTPISTEMANVSTVATPNFTTTEVNENSTDINQTVSAAEQKAVALFSVFLPIILLIVGAIFVIN